MAEDRYHRQTLIEGWDQDRVRRARVLVVGAGALGNEVLKLCALLGVGATLIYDPDRIERSNLSRAVLFRDVDKGRNKAATAAERVRELNPDARAIGRGEDVTVRAGLGAFLWADVVIGAVDNREARVFLSGACARARRPFVDGAIEGFSGVARAFAPHLGACYECTMNATDRRLLAERRSCARLMRDAATAGRVPATVVTASLVAALQVQEAVKLLHGQPALLGEGIHIDGLHGQLTRVAYPRREGCPGHDGLPPVVPLGAGSGDVTLGELLARAEARFGAGAALDFSRDVVTALACPACGTRAPGRAVLGALRERDAACPSCGAHRVVETAASVSRDAGLDLRQTPAELGLPPWDVVVARRGLGPGEAWLLDGDAPAVLEGLA